MSPTTFFLLSLSIIFAAILGVIRFRIMDPSYHPFVYYACLSVVVEIVVFVMLSFNLKIYDLTYNVFSMVEFYLFTWMFHNWGLFKKNENTFYIIICSGFLLFVSTLFIRGSNKSNNVGMIVNSFALIFFSISSFNKMILNERKNIFKNAKFWICIGIVIYYTYSILVCVQQLSFLHLNPTKDFRNKVSQINAYTNLFVNLLYAVAIIWVPRKKNILTLL